MGYLLFPVPPLCSAEKEFDSVSSPWFCCCSVTSHILAPLSWGRTVQKMVWVIGGRVLKEMGLERQDSPGDGMGLGRQDSPGDGMGLGRQDSPVQTSSWYHFKQ